MVQMDTKDKFASMWKKSRTDAGKSQDYMAKALGVSKKTIQNWEEGYSCPSQAMGFDWFQALGLEAMPYYLDILFPDTFKGKDKQITDEEVETALISLIHALRPTDKRKLLFIMYGEHGSSFNELLEMLTAHFHTPDENRITVAQNVCTNYEVAEATGTIIAPERIRPNIPVLKNAIIKKRNKILGTNTALLEEI